MPAESSLKAPQQRRSSGGTVTIVRPHILPGEKTILTLLTAAAIVGCLLANFLTGEIANVAVISGDIAATGVVFSVLAYIRMRLTRSDDWVGNWILAMFLTLVALLFALTWATFT